MDNIKEKYIYTLVLHALGDTIGFKNGEYEFNFMKKNVTLDMTLELVYDFIHLGGINRIDLTKWIVSDDTLFHLATAHALLISKNDINNIIKNIKENFIIVYKKIMDEGNIRYIGATTANSIKKFTDTKDARSMPYDENSGGNGCAMRTHVIGLAFHNNIDLLIEVAIESSRLTHNSPIGYLGGLTSALFTAYAIQGIDITEWGDRLIKILDSSKVRKYIRSDYIDQEEADYDDFVRFWSEYLGMRFDNGTVINTKAHKNLLFRSRFYSEHFTKNTRGKMIGDSGFSSVIMAYDCLLDARDVWEKLVIYAGLHWGDTDTVLSIAGGWFGALYGKSDVPDDNLKYLEYKKDLMDLGEKIHTRFNQNKEIKISGKLVV
jgi:ADP-ribosylarginine hydrolase